MKLSAEQLEITLKGCISGDRRSQESLFKAFFGKMMVVCYRYTRDRDTAQEIIQEAFIKVFDKISDYNSMGSFEGWMRRIVVNTAIDHIRKNKNIIVTDDFTNNAEDEDDSGEPVEDENTDTSIYTNIKPEMVIEALQQLTPAYRTVFNLYVYENYSHKEIAEMLNINIGTSKSNLAKARLKLKGILKKHLSYK